MRRTGFVATCLIGLALTACGEAGETISDTANQAISRPVKAGCEAAISGVVEKGPRSAGQLREALAGQLGEHLPAEYRQLADDIAAAIPREAAEQGLKDAYDTVAPPKQRAAWRRLAVQTCTDEAMNRVGVG